MNDEKLQQALVEAINNNEIKLYMNTWKNYNKQGANSYGKEGWMSVDEAIEFNEKYQDDEPFINDTENAPWEIDENSDTNQTLEYLQKYEELDEDDQACLKAIIESVDEANIEQCFEIFEGSDYIFLPGVDNEEDLARTYINDMLGEIDFNNPSVSNCIDENAYKESWREMAEESIREEYPELDENSDDFESKVDDLTQYLSDENLEAAKESNSQDLANYFDYEQYGRDLTFEGFYIASTGAIKIL